MWPKQIKKTVTELTLKEKKRKKVCKLFVSNSFQLNFLIVQVYTLILLLHWIWTGKWNVTFISYPASCTDEASKQFCLEEVSLTAIMICTPLPQEVSIRCNKKCRDNTAVEWDLIKLLNFKWCSIVPQPIFLLLLGKQWATILDYAVYS